MQDLKFFFTRDEGLGGVLGYMLVEETPLEPIENISDKSGKA